MIWQQGYYCNCCGRELDVFDIQANFSITKKKIGYGSVHDGDGVDLRLCCNCFDSLVKQCSFSPILPAQEDAT